MKKILTFFVLIVISSAVYSENIQDEIIQAVEKQDIKSIGRFLAEGADINGLSSTGFTPLLYAVVKQKVVAIDYLLSQGARPDFRGRTGLSPFSVAKSRGDDKLYRKMFQALETLGEVDPDMIKIQSGIKNQYPRLIQYIMDDNYKMFENAIKEGSDVNLIDTEGSTPLLYASFFGMSRYVSTLLEAGADVNVKDRDGYTALQLACIKGHTSVIRMLLGAKVDVNSANNRGQTALMIAASLDRSDLVVMLIEAGADLDAVDKDGYKFYSYGASRK